jgi:hypothetical protein
MKDVNMEADALVNPCALCGCAIHFDYTVTDEFWNQHAPREHQRGVLCLPCLDLVSGGIPPGTLLHVYYSGRAPTIPLVAVTGLRDFSEAALSDAARRVCRSVAPLLARLPCRTLHTENSRAFLPSPGEMESARSALMALAQVLERA